MASDVSDAKNLRSFRFSLLSALMATTIVAMAIVLALIYGQLRDAKLELARLRAEMGWVTVSDAEKVHGIAVESDEPYTWRWRLYLPPLPIGEYQVNCYAGRQERIAGRDPVEWLDKFRRAGLHYAIPKKNDLPLEGEVTIEARLVKKDGYWRMYVHPVGDDGVANRDDWLDDGRKIEITNGMSRDETSSFWWGDPVMLLCIQDEPSVVKRSHSFLPEIHRVPPTPKSNTIVLWISKQP